MKPHKRLLNAALLFIALITGMALWIVHVNAPPSAAGRLERGGALRVGFANLQPGRIDTTATGMFITPERLHETAFTRLPRRPQQADLEHKSLHGPTFHGATANRQLFQAGVPPEHIASVPPALQRYLGSSEHMALVQRSGFTSDERQQYPL